MDRFREEKGEFLDEELSRIGARLREIVSVSGGLDQMEEFDGESISEIGRMSDRFDVSLERLETKPPGLRPRREVPADLLCELREPLAALTAASYLLRESDLKTIDRLCLRDVYDDQTARLKHAVGRLVKILERGAPRPAGRLRSRREARGERRNRFDRGYEGVE